MGDIKNNRKVIRAKATFYVSLLVIIAVSAIVFLIGPQNIFRDLFIVVSVLSVMLLLFLTIGLYKGLTVHDDHPNMLKKFKFSDFFDISSYTSPNIDLDAGDSIIGIVVGVLVWIVVSLIISVLLAFLLMTLWAFIIVLIMAFYWIFYRAVRLVFIKSEECEGNFLESAKFGLLYTAMYTIWFYGIIYFSKIIKNT